jgi:hypothetical protein
MWRRKRSAACIDGAPAEQLQWLRQELCHAGLTPQAFFNAMTASVEVEQAGDIGSDGEPTQSGAEPSSESSSRGMTAEWLGSYRNVCSVVKETIESSTVDSNSVGVGNRRDNKGASERAMKIPNLAGGITTTESGSEEQEKKRRALKYQNKENDDDAEIRKDALQESKGNGAAENDEDEAEGKFEEASAEDKSVDNQLGFITFESFRAGLALLRIRTNLEQAASLYRAVGSDPQTNMLDWPTLYHALLPEMVRSTWKPRPKADMPQGSVKMMLSWTRREARRAKARQIFVVISFF